MRATVFLTFMALGTLMMGPVLFALSSKPRLGAPVLVVAPPWEGGARAVVQTAGLDEIGPQGAALAVLALYGQPDDLERLAAAGAWLVMDGEAIAAFCGV
ncbi:MAG: hypothetical protein JXR14_06180 [Paracoccaceae bacterium]